MADGWKEYVESRLPGECVDRVPSLEQVILFAKRYNLKLVIDLKESHDRIKLYEELIFLFQKYNLYKDAFIAAFNPWDIYFFKQCGGINIASCLLYSRNTLEWYHKEGGKEVRLPFFIDFKLCRWIADQLIVYFAIEIAELFGMQMVGPDWNLVSREFVKTCKTRGIGIYSWTVNGDLEKDYFDTFGVMFATDHHQPLKEPVTPIVPIDLPFSSSSPHLRSSSRIPLHRRRRYQQDSDLQSESSSENLDYASFRSAGTVVTW